MVNILTNYLTLKSAISWISSSKQHRFLAISSLAILISIPFLRPFAKKAYEYVWSVKEPENSTAPVREANSRVSKQSPALLPFEPFQFHLKVKSGQIIPIDVIDPEESLLNFVSRASDQVTQNNLSKRNISYYDDVKLIVCGKAWNTTQLEYFSVHQLYQEYKIMYLAAVYLIIHEQEESEVKELTHELCSQKHEISQLFQGIDWNDSEKAILQQFRASLHSYCDRIYRCKVETASLDTLEKLQKILMQIINQAPNLVVKNYFNGLLASVSNMYVRFQKSFKALWEDIDNRIRLMPPPEKPISTSNVISLGNQNFHFSLKDVSKHSTYFDCMKEFGSILDAQHSTHWNLNNKPDEVQERDLACAMQYLIGGDILQVVKDRPLHLSRAALFLGISRLVLMCELELIKGIEEGRLQQDDFKNVSIERIRLEMPHLYQAFDMKGWLKEDIS